MQLISNAEQVRGQVAPGLEAVRQVFADGLAEVGNGGAGFAVVVDGALVVDLWAGRAGGEPWVAGTRAVLMSATKGLSTVAIARLYQAGLLDVDEPVATYWPEFAAGGKANVTVAHVLSHTAGVVTIPAYREFMGPTGDGWDRTDEILRRLESASPAWPPGSAHGYHGLTFGWLVAELTRRVAGVGIGALIRDEIARPLGLELDLGTPRLRQHLVAPVLADGSLASPVEARELADPASLFSQMILAVAGASVLDAPHLVFNDGKRLGLELAGSNATGTARALARLYGTLASDRQPEGIEMLARQTIETFVAERVRGPSRLTGAPERWALGFQLATQSASGGLNEWGPHDEAYGHMGMGGQIGFADPVARLGLGFVRSHLSASSPLGGRLVEALYRCL